MDEEGDILEPIGRNTLPAEETPMASPERRDMGLLLVIVMVINMLLSLVVLPLLVGMAARGASNSEGADGFLESLPAQLSDPIAALPPRSSC